MSSNRSLGRWLVYSLAKLFLWIYFTLYHRLRVRGQEHVPRTGGVILAANHASFLDPPLVGVAAPRIVDFMAREDLFRGPFGLLIRWLGAFPLRREEQDFRAMREAIRRLHRGRLIVMFPEGTRSPDGSLQAPKVGIGFLAAMTNAPVVPVAISGSDQAFGRHTRWVRPHRIEVIFGEPVRLEELALTEPKGARYHTFSHIVMERIALLKGVTFSS